MMLYFYLIIAIVGTILFWKWLLSLFRLSLIVEQDSVALHFRNGQLTETLTPGRYVFWTWSSKHRFEVIDTRLKQFSLQTQELTSAEGISIKTTAVGLYRVINPKLALSSTDDYQAALYTLVQLALRDIVNGIEAEELLRRANELGPQLLAKVKPRAENLGLEFTELVIRDVILPAEIKNALSEAWRSKKSSLAELEAARGKSAAARIQANMAKQFAANPSLLKLRELEVLEKLANSYGNTFVLGASDTAGLSLSVSSKK